MPAAKGKGGPTSHRYRPASEYDDATLAQKREYWRNKKREQRARLSEQRRKPAQESQKEKVPYRYVSAGGTLSDSSFSPPFQSSNDSHFSPMKRRNTDGVSSTDAANRQKEDWLETANINKVSLRSLEPKSCSVLAPAAETVVVKRPTVRRGSSVVSSPTSTGTQLSTSSSVPPVMMTRIPNGSSMNTEPQPHVSMQRKLGPRTQFKAQLQLPIQPAVLPTNVTTDTKLISSCGPVSIKTEGKTPPPQSGTTSALVTTQRAKGVGSPRPSLESEEEKAAKRRENWRLKKREQRAKLAARIAKFKERMQRGDGAVQRLTAQKTGIVPCSVLLPSQPFLKGTGQKHCPVRVKVPFPAVRRDSDKVQSRSTTVAVPNLQMDQMNVQNINKNMQTQTAISTFDVNSVKRPTESQRKPSHVNHCNVTRGAVRCKTPRPRFTETQKSFLTLRNLRCKPSSVALVFTTRSMPKIDPSDTPEQIIAKRREYWRIKKREQRAKLSLEMKSRVREKDSLMRRVKRYQQILAEMRKARSLAHPTGSGLPPASETIGGFIKEDGTLTVNIPQGATYQKPAGETNEEELCGVSKKTSMTQPQHRTTMTRRSVDPIRVSQPPPPLWSSQVKGSSPLPVQSVSKTPRLLLMKPQPPLLITTVPGSQSLTPTQLSLTHPQPSQHAASAGATRSNGGSCVMKMAVSNCSPSLSVLSHDLGMTEEEKMAKKREYWRVKKREQRAARAVRLKHSLLQARSSAASLKRKAQSREVTTALQTSTSLTTCRENPHVPDNTVPALPHTKEIKQESESVSEVDLNSPPEQAICPDIKPPTSPPASPMLEPEPSLSTDSQATTLLAVASMKKLLEESLSTVTECQSEQTSEDASEQDVKPSLSELSQLNDMTSMAADLTLLMKSWEPGGDVLAHKHTSSPELKDSSLITDTLPPFPACGEAVHFTCEHSSQTSPKLSVNLSVETSNGSTSPHRTQSLCSKKTAHQNYSSPEPPKLHHIPATSLDQSEPQQQDCEQQSRCQNNNLQPAQRYSRVGTERSGWTSLQKKREYWKLMKRQQRARLRARQEERQGASSSQRFPRSSQTGGFINTASQNKPAVQSIPSDTSVNGIPGVVIVSKTTCNADRHQVKPPATSREENNMNIRPSQCCQVWTPRSTEIPSAPSLPALKPPDNPLSSIHLQPVECPGQRPNSVLSPIKIPCAELQSPTKMEQPCSKPAPVSTMVPPKPMPGEPEEDFLRRKREYWRIKKKEQRARKAIRDKDTTPNRVSNSWKPVLPAPDPLTQTGAPQNSGQWLTSSEDSKDLKSMSVDLDPGPLTQSTYAAQVEDESMLPVSDYDGYNDEEGPLSEVVWRNWYLMDYDPLNQLLVCMVCGELQYSHSLEGVRAHIDEAHPHTLTLEPSERQRILEAWDEQVSQRERFFTSQLQQHTGALTETFGN